MAEPLDKPPCNFQLGDAEYSDEKLYLGQSGCFLCTKERTSSICTQCLTKGHFDSVDKLFSRQIKCWLCTNVRSCFICHWCLRKGDFVLRVSTNPRAGGWPDQKADLKGMRYIDRKMHLIKVEAAKLDVLTSIGEKLDVYQRKLKLIEAIDVKKQRLVEIQAKKAAVESSFQQSTKESSACRQCNLSHAKRIKKMRTITESNDRTIEEYRNRMRRKQEELDRLMGEKTTYLVKHVDVLKDVFPTYDLEPQRSEEDDLSPVTAALVEASSTSYLGGRWVDSSTGHSHHQKMIQIVHSRIPLTLSESLFQILETEVTAASLNSSMDPFEVTSCILPGLAYSAQVTNLLAYFLNFRLPKKVSYRSFLGDDNPEKLRKSFCRLTFNLVYLAAHLRIPGEALETPYNPVQLLKAVFDSDIKFTGDPPIIRDTGFVYTIVDDDWEDDDEKGEDGEPLSGNDWESVTAALPSIVPPSPGSIHVAASFVSSAAAGVASLWRGFAGK